MDRRDRRECAGLVRARTETGLVAPARGGRIPGLPSRDHALLRGCRGRGRGPDRSVWPPAATVGASGDGARTALALGRHVRHRDRRESPVPRLAGILRFATVPALERAVVLRRLGCDRRSLLLGGAARGARVGRSATLGTRARVPRHAPWSHDAGVVARPRPRRVVGTAGDGGVRGGRRGGLDPALVRSGGPGRGGAGRSRNSRGSLRRRWIRATAVSTYRCGMCATTHPGRAPTAGRRCRSGSADAVRLGGAMSHPSPPADLLDDVVRALTPAYRLDQRVAATPERAVYHAWDRVLKRSVALHVHLAPDSPGRAWFLRETETLAALDHPAIRHVYAAGVGGTFAYRTANWVEGEGLAEALRRGPRPIRTAHALVRDLLGAAEHAHARGVILRRIVPLTLMLELTGRAVITDLRYCNWCLPNVPPEEQGAGGAFVAPEVRTGSPGEPRSDVYGVAALVYYVLTGQEPDLDPARITPPRQLRPAVPAALRRVLVRALQAAPGGRYYTATEMLEDFVSDAGVFQEPAAAPQVAEAGFERRLRRALGDDYELLEEIGTGGFGRVYRARDLGLERDVAMKVLHPSLTTDPSVMERFRREAQLAGGLRHPSIVSIYDISSRAGLQWYTMELVPGTNLAQLVHKQGPLSLDQTVRLVDQGLSALEHAHALGLVHRDLKPENMLIEPDGRLRITDFGLALALRGDARFGGATSRSGTPQFAAPEQLLGERVDQRADIYSLAATAYFALLGRPPFEGPTPEAIVARQTTEDPPSLHDARKDVPRELEDVLRKALASEAAARYPTATAFRDALRRSRGLLFRLRALLWGK